MHTHVYLMPGMAASPSIFEYLDLPKEEYTLHPLSWKNPLYSETLEEYAARMVEDVKHDLPVLLGVSFGGLLVQEMAKHIPYKKLIIVSSVKTRSELPRKMKFSRKWGLYRIAPVGIFRHMDRFTHFAFNAKIKHKIELYQKYLSVNDPVYLNWALEQMLCWEQREPLKDIVHIHGDADLVFPYKYIKGCITVPGGTHVMIMTKHKWFNDHLPQIIAN